MEKMASAGGRIRGRIYPHQRDANMTGTILGDSIELDTQYVQTMNVTASHGLVPSTKRGHRNRIQHVYTAWAVLFPAYYLIGVRDLSAEELNDPANFFHKNKKELVYDGLNVKFLLAFLATKKKKTNGQMNGYENIRKYWDAIQYGAKEASISLPVTFYQAKEKFLSAYKKEVAAAKVKGEVDEQEADPIPMSPFALMCRWAVGEGNIFVWAWSILQWNLMGRSVNVEPLNLRNIKVYEDHIQFLYTTNKCDKAGEKVTTKNVYANRMNPFICSFLSLGIYVSLNAERFKVSEYLFRKTTAEEDKLASSGYCSQLKEMFNRHGQEVSNHIRLPHANAHGLRKGGSTYATSGTTAPPSITAVARRGEWSMGKVLDVYWQCSEIGDHYLGRVLAGLNSLSPSFDIMPPHFKCEDPLSDPHIREAMQMMYGPILKMWKDTQQDPEFLLLRLLASVVYHMEWIKSIARTSSTHPFNSIPLMFASPELVVAL